MSQYQDSQQLKGVISQSNFSSMQWKIPESFSFTKHNVEGHNGAMNQEENKCTNDDDITENKENDDAEDDDITLHGKAKHNSSLNPETILNKEEIKKGDYLEDFGELSNDFVHKRNSVDSSFCRKSTIIYDRPQHTKISIYEKSSFLSSMASSSVISTVNSQMHANKPNFMNKCIDEEKVIDFLSSNKKLHDEMSKCSGCGLQILDEYLLKVEGKAWHAFCLKCYQCGHQLTKSCYYRKERLYCKEDFDKVFGSKCDACEKFVPSTSTVRRVNDNVYHLECFCCFLCRTELQTGDQFYLLDDNRLVCKNDYEHTKLNEGEIDIDNSTKRPRTSISSKQLDTLKHAYEQSPKPARHVREQLSTDTGLHMRVVQVWFQNRRAKEKRMKKDGGRQQWDNFYGSPNSSGRASKQEKVSVNRKSPTKQYQADSKRHLLVSPGINNLSNMPFQLQLMKNKVPMFTATNLAFDETEEQSMYGYGENVSPLLQQNMNELLVNDECNARQPQAFISGTVGQFSNMPHCFAGPSNNLLLSSSIQNTAKQVVNSVKAPLLQQSQNYTSLLLPSSGAEVFAQFNKTASRYETNRYLGNHSSHSINSADIANTQESDVISNSSGRSNFSGLSSSPQSWFEEVEHNRRY